MENFTIDLTQIILAIISLLGAIAVRYLVPLMKEKLTDAQISRLMSFVRVGVYAAEQLYGPEKGAEKKLFVQELLKERGFDVDLTEVDAAIEATVKGLKIELSGQNVIKVDGKVE